MPGGIGTRALTSSAQTSPRSRARRTASRWISRIRIARWARNLARAASRRASPSDGVGGRMVIGGSFPSGRGASQGTRPDALKVSGRHYFREALRDSHTSRDGAPARNQSRISDTSQSTFPPIFSGLGNLPPASHARTQRSLLEIMTPRPLAATASKRSFRRFRRLRAFEGDGSAGRRRRGSLTAAPFALALRRAGQPAGVGFRGPERGRSASWGRLRTRRQTTRPTTARAAVGRFGELVVRFPCRDCSGMDS